MVATKKSWIIRKERYGKSGSKNPELRKQKITSSIKKAHEEGRHKGSLGKHWKQTAEQVAKRSGSNAWMWKGGKTDPRKLIRNHQEYKEWRSKVFERDNWTCQTCGKRGVYLEAHHIKEFVNYPELCYEISNGVTLCYDCHQLTKKGRRTNL